MYKKQIAVITTRTDHGESHESKVNDFLAQSIEISDIQHYVHSGSSLNKYSKSEIVTIITYKGEQ